ncbi:hypothetical protein APF79_10890 [bacterium BRH_c32]|nr:MAG: hypothetical protein APF79_10890 [bacterium BRH_c32]
MHKKNKLFKNIWIIAFVIFTITVGCEDRNGITFPLESTPPVVNSTDPTNFATGVAINKNITVLFSEAIDATTLSTATFILKQGSITVPGVVLASGTSAIFIPSDNLSPNTTFTATITTGIKDLAHNAMAANYVWSFTTGATADITSPLVNFTDPLNAATNVIMNKIITVTFSKAMDVSTMATAFKLMQGTATIPGTVTYSGTTASFTPTSNLAPNTIYTGTVSTAAKDIAGNALSSNYVWNFTTGTTQDISAPTVILTDPLNIATGVVLTKKVSATFSEAIDASTITTATFTLMLSTTVISGTVSYSGLTAVFTPLSNLLPNTLYTATLTKSIKDLAGNAMASNYVWTFTTSAMPYTVSLSSSPAVGGTTNGGGAFDSGSSVTVTASPNTGYTFSNWTENGIIVSTNSSYQFTINGNRNLIANFMVASAQYSITLSSNPLVGGTTSGGGAFNSGSSVTVTAAPNAGYTFSNWTENGIIVSTNANYQFTIVQDRTLIANFITASAQYSITLSSNPLVGGTTSGGGSFNSGTLVTVTATPNAGYTFTSWTEGITIASSNANYTFTITGNKILVANFTASGPSGPASVNLGSAGNFAILAGSGVSNTGVTTRIYGDVGAFPTATINGLLAGNVIGILYTSADPLVGAAKNALTAAYNDAQARSLNAISLPGQLGGLTLAPGLYVNSTSTGISGTGANGILTLDAGGNPNAVWIFKMGSTLITSTGTSIVLAGGAKWSNIYWSVGTSATLGTNSIFYGNILADQSITLTTGATLRGRALTRIGTVTLDTNIVDKR